MRKEDFKLHDVSRFPIVVLHGRSLPPGYGPTWANELEALLSQDRPFVMIFPNSVQDEAHEDQKLRTVFLKANRERLAAKCIGIFGVEPNKATRLLKRVQGAALAAAFGLRFRVVATVEEAERLASLALAGAPVPDDAEQD
ncbi:MAG: GntR family transcriptional regulator [Rhizobiales bacterium]|nr:GntR family transcriptional regulator [Hyphomicrobiales bacterium]